MIAYLFSVICFLKLVSGNENETSNQCYSWSYNDAFFINESSLAESAVLDRVESRSFVECCVKCDAAQGCHGVAFRDGECSRLDGTAAQSFVVLNGSRDGYKVMMYNTATDGKIHHRCIGECQKCPSPSDCRQLLENGHTSDGEYTLVNGTRVYCDMTGGGWTVIQRRVNDTVDFNRNWADYVAGFGNLSESFWAGLDNIHNLTSGSATELYVSMDTFEGESAFARYTSFSVGDVASGYMMTVNGYSGTAGNAMAKSNYKKFSTIDYDWYAWYCPMDQKGGWWYEFCGNANPNGLYLHGYSSEAWQGITWLNFPEYDYNYGYRYSLKSIEFKIRRI